MTGNASANYLLGGAGDDILNGKAGNDVLFGQAGADRFVFEHGTGGDVIGDFQVGIDKIDLTAIGYSWAQVQNAMHENGGTTAIDLGGGDLVVLNGIAASSLQASDFILGGGTAAAVPAPATGQGIEGFRVALAATHDADVSAPADSHALIAHAFILDGTDSGIVPVAFVEAQAPIDHGAALIA
jgi:hypothetical protein